jgi:predicted PurR-regulated permease PerM
LPLIVLNGWVLILLLDYFQPIVTKFVVAMLLAFILSYPVGLLQKLKIPRGRAVLMVLLMAIALLGTFGLTVGPILIEQVNELVTRLPTWIDSGNQQLRSLQLWATIHRLPIDLDTLITELEARLSSQVQEISGTFINVVLDTIGSVLNILLTLVLTFYLLIHGERLWNGIFQWVPPQVRQMQVRKAFRQNFQNYFRGQATLALLMAMAMVITFVLIQVPFGLLFGLGVGGLAFFPFGAPLGIVIVSVITTLKSIWLGLRVLTFAIIVDQLIENAVAPQLIGGFTGLNPVWILISLLVGAKIGGILGLIIAVPLASSLKSIADRLRSSDEIPATVLAIPETVSSTASVTPTPSAAPKPTESGPDLASFTQT